MKFSYSFLLLNLHTSCCQCPLFLSWPPGAATESPSDARHGGIDTTGGITVVGTGTGNGTISKFCINCRSKLRSALSITHLMISISTSCNTQYKKSIGQSPYINHSIKQWFRENVTFYHHSSFKFYRQAAHASLKSPPTLGVQPPYPAQFFPPNPRPLFFLIFFAGNPAPNPIWHSREMATSLKIHVEVYCSSDTSRSENWWR